MTGIDLNTFSITARCKETGMLGVAVSTARPCVGGLAPYAKAGVGAIATQARLNAYYGIDGLKHLQAGLDSEEALKIIQEADDGFELRQIAIVDNSGRTAAFTGKKTVPWAGHYVGDQFVAAGNMLVSEDTVTAMAKSFENSGIEYFPERLLAALRAGQDAGGDKRGKQSAALYVVDDLEYALVDIRADEDEAPVTELERIYAIWKKELFPYIDDMPKRSSK